MTKLEQGATTSIASLITIGPASREHMGQFSAGGGKDRGEHSSGLFDTHLQLNGDRVPGKYRRYVDVPQINTAGKFYTNPLVRPRMHKNSSFLWLPIGDDPLLIIVGGEIDGSRNYKRTGREIDRSVITGTRIIDGREYKLNRNDRPLLIPSGTPHWPGTAGLGTRAAAIVFPITPEQTENVKSIPGVQTANSQK